MTTSADTMRQITSNVFDEMLAMPTTDFDTADAAFAEERIIAAIRISGAVEEIVVVETPQTTADIIGETMFDAPADELDPEEIRDAVGEVVNMIGGNVKGIYEGDSKLSLPCVSKGVGNPEDWVGAPAIAVTVSGQPLIIRWREACVAEV